MSFEFHTNKPKYFEFQRLNAERFVVPFIEEDFPLYEGMKVLEIGCAEGGVLKAFTDRGCQATGVELSASKIENAKKFMADEWANGQVEFICQNIYEVDFTSGFERAFDLIILKDTIEHIHDQAKLISHLPSLLKQGGRIFFGFPPWEMPWGGHQQTCKSRILSVMPYFHLLPVKAYTRVLKLFGESNAKINDLLEIKSTGISTRQFERIIYKSNLEISHKRFYLVNPIYEYKFRLKARIQFDTIAGSFLRDYLTTTAFYLVKKHD